MISRKGEERIASGPVIEKTRVDLACGNEFGSGDGWIYLDYHAWCGDVRRGDLLGGYPWADGSAALVYSSHFLGHIPRSDAPDFFSPSAAGARAGWGAALDGAGSGQTLPGLRAHRERNEHSKANFLVLEIVDQCVRCESGGELGGYYQALRRAPTEEDVMIGYVKERTGEDLPAASRAGSPSSGGARSLSQRPMVVSSDSE